MVPPPSRLAQQACLKVEGNSRSFWEVLSESKGERGRAAGPSTAQGEAGARPGQQGQQCSHGIGQRGRWGSREQEQPRASSRPCDHHPDRAGGGGPGPSSLSALFGEDGARGGDGRTGGEGVGLLAEAMGRRVGRGEASKESCSRLSRPPFRPLQKPVPVSSPRFRLPAAVRASVCCTFTAGQAGPTLK